MLRRFQKSAVHFITELDDAGVEAVKNYLGDKYDSHFISKEAAEKSFYAHTEIFTEEPMSSTGINLYPASADVPNIVLGLFTPKRAALDLMYALIDAGYECETWVAGSTRVFNSTEEK